jgi:DNA-binding SARP family transcriptional activator
MQFRILGPVEVVDEGTTLAVGGGRQLALFALLLIHANEVVSADTLVDELWPGQPPATAEKIVRNYVSLLRKQLGDRLVRRPPGYLLRVEPGELDRERFETLVRAARGREPEDAVKTLRQALALWSGPPLAQLAYEPFAQRAIADLEERRLQALEDRIDADLQLGDDRDLVPELERLVREQPLRERLTSLLMQALYRSGRQADALEALPGCASEAGRRAQARAEPGAPGAPATDPHPRRGSRRSAAPAARRAPPQGRTDDRGRRRGPARGRDRRWCSRAHEQ